MLDYILKSLPVFFLELFAALAGTYYLKKIESRNFEIRILIWFFWFNFFIEVAGLYTIVAYFSNYEYFSFIKGTLFERNFWLYNIRNIIEFVVFTVFFLSHLRETRWKKVLKTLGMVLVPAMILNLIFSGVYFESYSQFTGLSATFMYVILIFRYFYEILQSEEILHFFKKLSFYIAISLLLWHLCITPFFIYSKYFKAPNLLFVEMQRLILLSMNVYMYSCLIFGFLYCAFKNKSAKKLNNNAPI